MSLTPKQIQALRAAMERRRDVLTEELDRDLARVREVRFATLAGESPDRAEESVAALIGDIDRAELSRDVTELGAIEAALRRMSEGNFGLCFDCGIAIGLERLQAEPTAQRCLDCQRRHEKTYREKT